MPSPILSTYGRKPLRASPAWTLVASFGTYFCMYGFRKPYTAATFSDTSFFGLDYKVLLVAAQTTGYVISKWMGIRVISEIKACQRIPLLLSLIGFAEFMLLLFGLIPRPWNILCLLFNGLPLGIVFGLVLRYLEGRKNTELLVAGLCTSFIISDGFSKSIGKLLLEWGITENWMPFGAGLLFLLPTLLFIAMLALVPPPGPEDIASRCERTPMDGSARWNFFKKFAPGLSGILVIYLLATLLRSIRADFAPEIWSSLGYHQTPALFTQTELIVSFAVIILNGLIIFLKNHRKAFQFSLLLSTIGFFLLLMARWFLVRGMDSYYFMVFTGLGVYLPYVSVHTTLFERLVAANKEKANIGFLMYLADSVGYSGYILLMVFQYAAPRGFTLTKIFLTSEFFIGIIGIFILLLCYLYFKRKIHTNDQSIEPAGAWQSSHI